MTASANGAGPAGPVTHRRPRWRWLAVGLAVAGLAVATGWLGVSEHGLATARSSLARTTAALQQRHTAVARTRRARTADSATLASRKASVRSAQAALVASNQQLADDGQSVAQAGQDLTDLQGCLLGVDGAYGALTGGGDLPAAVTALDNSSGDCLAADGGAASGLAYPFDFPDPFVLTVGETYYAYGTNAAAGNIQIVTSTDLAHWSPVGDALPQLPSWAAPGGGTWAPSVLQLGGTFVLYFSAVYGTANEQCIGAAVSSSPTGPFVDASSFPIVCQLAQGGSIDPSPFVDPAGGLFLDWKSQGANGQAPTIWAQPMAGTGTQLGGNGPTAVLGPSQSWEHGWTEAPDMFWLGGQRYLFYAGSDWKTASYGIGVAECSGPLGPCHKPLDHPIFSSQGIIAGPGGASAFTDVDGHPWIAFAAWLTGEVGFPHSRVLFLRPLEVVDGVPAVCPSPATTAAPPPAQCP
jgi:hypothetical protein